MTTTINTIVRETERAMLINLPVNWADNCYAREFWFPKSVVSVLNAKTIEIKDWFAEKMSKENTYNGYRMYFGI